MHVISLCYSQTCQVLLTNVDMAQSLEVLKYLFIQTQPDTTSTLPLDLRDSAYITTAISNLFVRNLHQNGSIQDTFVSHFSVDFNRLQYMFLIIFK